MALKDMVMCKSKYFLKEAFPFKCSACIIMIKVKELTIFQRGKAFTEFLHDFKNRSSLSM